MVSGFPRTVRATAGKHAKAAELNSAAFAGVTQTASRGDPTSGFKIRSADVMGNSANGTTGGGGRIRTDKDRSPVTCGVTAFTSFATPPPLAANPGNPKARRVTPTSAAAPHAMIAPQGSGNVTN